MRKTISAFALASTLMLGACTPVDLAGLIRFYCGIEPNINDLAGVIVPAGANTEAMIDAAARAFCQAAATQSAAPARRAMMAPPSARVSGGVVRFRDASGRMRSVRYAGTPR